ncbi:hypothetical protein [Streptomyces sp. NPDC004721]
MGRRLAAAVHVQHPQTNEWLILQPGDEPDEDLAATITHPDAWEPNEGEPGENGEGADDGDREPAAQRVTDPAPSPAATPEPEPTPAQEPEAKPRPRIRKQADA